MRNVSLVTRVPKKLTDVTNMSLTVQWDPLIYTNLLFQVSTVMRVNQLIRIRFLMFF